MRWQLQRAAAVDDRCVDPEMLHPHQSADLKWGRSELGVQSGRTNQLACLSVCDACERQSLCARYGDFAMKALEYRYINDFDAVG